MSLLMSILPIKFELFFNYFSDKKTMYSADCIQEKPFVNKYVVKFLVPANIYDLFSELPTFVEVENV